VVANRGANGIDGVVATAIGVALARGDRTATVLIGDVALCHDASSLTALCRRDVSVRIVALDNDGGGIFSFLPQATTLDGERFEQLFGTPHGTDLEALARAHHLPASTASTPAELHAVLDVAGSCLVRVASGRPSHVAVHAHLHAAVAAAQQV
jgi:2-succinyl-5-enolpyruvyl-6-hydroxy-3-cyclohexene-1-carboxylate synthase